MTIRHEQRYQRVIVRLDEPRGLQRKARTRIRASQELGLNPDSIVISELVAINKLTNHKLGVRQ